MTHPRIIVIGLPLIFLLAAVFLPGTGQEQKKPSTVQRVFSEERFPIADYLTPDPADPMERSKRHVRGRNYDNSDFHVHPNTLSDTNVRVDYIDRSLPAFPFEKSSIVLIGQVTDAHAYLSNDKTGVYSVFKVQIHEVLKNSSTIQLASASAIEVEREGGRVRFPHGRLHLYMISEQDMPCVGLRYVLFLTSRSEADFRILTGYELRAGKVYPLDNLPNTRNYQNVDEALFLRDLRTHVTN